MEFIIIWKCSVIFSMLLPLLSASLIVCCPFIRLDEGFVVYYNNDKNFEPKTRQEFCDFFFGFLGSGKMKPLPPIILTAVMDHSKHALAAHKLGEMILMINFGASIILFFLPDSTPVSISSKLLPVAS